jgi:small-conductance mechanosensitive channel
VKLSTADNLFVRVPNETLVKAQITNLSRHPIRRYDMQLGIGYGEKIGRVREILMGVAEKNPLCLREPAPLLLFQGFGESTVKLQFSIWAASANFIALRNTMAEDVKEALDREEIDLPLPQRALTAGGPIPVTIVSGEIGRTAE